MKKLRILHTNFLKYMLGESNRILLLAKELQARGHYVVIASPPHSAMIEQAKAAKIETFNQVNFRSGFHLRADMSDVLKLARLISEKEIDIVHTHGSKDTWTAALATKIFSKRAVVVRTRHNIFPVRRHFLNCFLYRKLIDEVIAISEFIRESFIIDNFLPLQKVALIHTGVDLTRFNPSAHNGSKFRQEFGIQADELVVGTIGGIVPYKGHRYFIEAAAQVLREFPKVRFFVVGDGDSWLERELKERVATLGLTDTIIFTGFRTDIPAIIAGWDLLVHPSLQEGLGTVIIEALALKKPVIASRVGGIPDIVVHEQSGLLVPPADTNALATSILTLLKDEKLRQALADNGRKLVETKFSTEQLVTNTECCYYLLTQNT